MQPAEQTPDPVAAGDPTPSKPAEHKSFLRWHNILAEPRPLSTSLSRATWFSVSAAICCALIYLVYARFHAATVGWAVISSILCLIPDVKQSVATALARVSANVIGAIIGLIVAKLVGDGSAAIILAVILVAYICHVLRLDLGLRTACVGVVIVMTTNPSDVTHSSFTRFAAVIVGCAVGVSVQMLVLVLQRSTRRAALPLPAMISKLTSPDPND